MFYRQLLDTNVVHKEALFSESSVSQIYFALASISNIQSSNILGYTVHSFIEYEYCRGLG